jgi:hypothetical protein
MRRFSWPAWLPRLSRRSKVAPAPAYSSRTESNGSRHLLVRGDAGRLTKLLLDVIQETPAPLGIALVEYRAEEPVEWVSSGLDRGTVLEGILSVRDLVGRGAVDLAVFSQIQGLELFLDRLGILEIRTGAWNEPRLISVLDRLGFHRVPRVSLASGDLDPGAAPWDEESLRRFDRTKERLDLARPGNAGEADARS